MTQKSLYDNNDSMVRTFLRTDSLIQKNCITGSRKENNVTVIMFRLTVRKMKMATTQVKG